MALERAQERMLIEQAAAGDRAAAAMIITSYQASLYAYLLRLTGKPDVAEDISQDAFVRVLTNLDRFDPRYRFSTWLFTIARRLWVNACQKHKPAYDTDIVSSRGGPGELPEAPIVEVEVNDNAKDLLQRALMHLNETQREVVVLFLKTGGGWDYDENIEGVYQTQEEAKRTVLEREHTILEEWW